MCLQPGKPSIKSSSPREQMFQLSKVVCSGHPSSGRPEQAVQNLASARSLGQAWSGCLEQAKAIRSGLSILGNDDCLHFPINMR